MNDKRKPALIDDYAEQRRRARETAKEHGILELADIAVKVVAATEVHQIRKGIEEQTRTIQKAAATTAAHQEEQEHIGHRRNELLRESNKIAKMRALDESQLATMQKKILKRTARQQEEERDKKRIVEIKRKHLGIHLEHYDTVLELARAHTMTMPEAARAWRTMMREAGLEFMLPGHGSVSREEILERSGVKSGLKILREKWPSRAGEIPGTQDFELEDAIKEAMDSGTNLRKIVEARIARLERKFNIEATMAAAEEERVTRIATTGILPFFETSIAESTRELEEFRAELRLATSRRPLPALALLAAGIIAAQWTVRNVLPPEAVQLLKLQPVLELVFPVMHLITGISVAAIFTRAMVLLWRVSKTKRRFRGEARELLQRYPGITVPVLFEQGGHAWFRITGDPAHRGMDLLCASQNQVFTHNDGADFLELHRRWEDATDEARTHLAGIMFFAIAESMRRGVPVQEFVERENIGELVYLFKMENKKKESC